ncbi:hypothetical protein GDO86_009496 [Hymenochirus boettgeri]|uniref:COG complex component COG2 C-terminal domain-containing protein n=1 Tax=Hymenochirus boettgeri TaxID=247094 RepID=A0A8T2JLX0_9PIPI|nr:hypothetical protein GDO86_009496 [Hymenochirus boettgeri]
MPELLEILKPKLQQTGFKNMPIIEGALDDMQVFLSPSLLAIKNKIVLDIGGSCFAHLKCALEVPRLYRRTNKEIPKKPSSYVDNALKPLFYLQNQCKNILKQSIREELLIRALCICTPKYYDTLSDVLSSLKKMEESLKRLKQARKTAASSVTNRGNSDDHKIRLQLALDVDFFSNQVQNLGLRKDEIESFQALTDLVYTAKEQAIAE